MISGRTQLSLIDKTASVVAWLGAAALFSTVGWLAMEPDDPRGAVSMLTRNETLMMLVQSAALAGVVAAAATIIAGRRLADIGTFAAAIGLATVALRGQTVTHLLIETADSAPGSVGGLTMKLALEAMGWFGVVALSLVVSAIVMRWFYGDAEDSEDPLRRSASRSLAGYDIPGLGNLLLGSSRSGRTVAIAGLKHTLIASGASILGMSVLSAGLASRAIQHGQACFLVAASICIGAYVAHRFAPVRSALWSVLSVPILAVVGYVWAALRPSDAGAPVAIPVTAFLRILPIQYIAVGTATAIAMFWSHHAQAAETHADRGEKGSTTARGTGA